MILGRSMLKIGERSQQLDAASVALFRVELDPEYARTTNRTSEVHAVGTRCGDVLGLIALEEVGMEKVETVIGQLAKQRLS